MDIVELFFQKKLQFCKTCIANLNLTASFQIQVFESLFFFFLKAFSCSSVKPRICDPPVSALSDEISCVCHHNHILCYFFFKTVLILISPGPLYLSS